MVKFTLKNISNICPPDNPLVTHISEKCKSDISFNKFLNLVLKYNILIFEKDNVNKWSFKSKLIILNQIDKSIGVAYNDHIINITKVSSENDSSNFIEIKQILDKLHLGLKKKLLDLYELKNLLGEVVLDMPEPVQVETIQLTNQTQKKKKIINNDIYIEEFSN
jgi:hypothetical protein